MGTTQTKPVTLAPPQNDCAAMADAIQGHWKNLLGSTTQLRADATTRVIDGEYQTAVGRANGTYPVTGRFTCSGALVMGVSWENGVYGDSGSATGWVGRIDPEDPKVLDTTWLLVNTKGEKWRSTTTNKDVFTKVK